MSIAQLEPKKSEFDVNVQVGREVRSWMARRGLRQAWLASVLGLSQSVVSKRLRGVLPFTVAELFEVCAVLDITLAQLLGDEIINEKDPHREGGGLITYTPRDSNPEPTDYESRPRADVIYLWSAISGKVAAS